MTKQILVIAPHSDDAELGLGGYIHREAANGAEVRVEVLAQGSASYTKDNLHGRDMRQIECQLACAILGVASVNFTEVAPDGEFLTTSPRVLVDALEFMFFEDELDELFIPLPSFHGDHKATYDAAIAALRPHLNRTFPKAIFAYEYPGNVWGTPVPDMGKVYAVLSHQNLDAKLAALGCHKSQWVSDPNALWGKRGVQALAELRGTEINELIAERFYVIRQVLK